MNPERSEADIEREQVEWVFGLTGGELEDKPWEPFAPSTEGEKDCTWALGMGGLGYASSRETFAYHYDGVPDYCGRREYDDLYANGVEYRTVVYCCLFGSPPEHVVDGGQLWTRVASYTTSGETECPERQEGGEVEEDECPLCGADHGEEHSYIYIGEGWSEVVYRAEVHYCEECSNELTLPGPRACADCNTELAAEQADD